MQLPAIARVMLDDIHAQNIDHIALSGDLTNIGMPAEHRQSLAWLKLAGTPEKVSAIPGNHDIYCRLWFDQGTKRWAEYMSSTENTNSGENIPVEPFPFVRRWGDIALIGVNSAIPTRTGSAIGFVGDTQRKRLECVLKTLGAHNVCRIVMIHHPPLPEQAPSSRALRDADALEDLLMNAGAELVIHGHNHKNMLEYRAWNGHAMPVVGVPSFSAASDTSEPAAYNIYTFTPAGSRYSVDLTQRRISDDHEAVYEVRHERLLSRI